MFTIQWKDRKNTNYTTSSKCIEEIKTTVHTLQFTGMKVLSVKDSNNKRVQLERQ